MITLKMTRYPVLAVNRIVEVKEKQGQSSWNDDDCEDGYTPGSEEAYAAQMMRLHCGDLVHSGEQREMSASCGQRSLSDCFGAYEHRRLDAISGI